MVMHGKLRARVSYIITPLPMDSRAISGALHELGDNVWWRLERSFVFDCFWPKYALGDVAETCRLSSFVQAKRRPRGFIVGRSSG